MLDDTPRKPRHLQDGTIACLARLMQEARDDCGEKGARNVAQLVVRAGYNYSDAARQYARDYLASQKV